MLPDAGLADARRAGMDSEVLTREEELSLIERYRRTSDRRLEDRLVRSQMRLVHHMAKAHRLEGLEHADLVQEGALGVLQALRRFDPERGVRLSTYATWWIRAYQYRHILQNCRLVRVGISRAQRRVFFRLRTVRARLTAAGLEPTAERLAQLMGVSEAVAQSTAQRLDTRELSLDQPLGDERQGAAVDSLPDGAVALDELAAARQTARIVKEERERYRATLSGRRRELFDARWLDEEQPTLQEMARRFGVSRERTRQIEQSMLQVLRKRLRPQVA
jgi:RNA polymerase sigma-32 factor